MYSNFRLFFAGGSRLCRRCYWPRLCALGDQFLPAIRVPLDDAIERPGLGVEGFRADERSLLPASGVDAYTLNSVPAFAARPFDRFEACVALRARVWETSFLDRKSVV